VDLSFYKLTTKPFPEKIDPARLWLNEKTQKELDTFRDGIIADRGIMLLTGDVGTGKTTFINTLISSLPENIVVGNVVNSGLDRQGLLQVLADIFHYNIKEGDQEELLLSFTQFLVTTAGAGKKILLIIDEAQQLSDDVVELIQLLADLDSEDNGSKLLSIILVGQNDFNTVLFQPENSDLRLKIAVTYNIDPLTKAETEQYIKHHLRLAGGSEDLFSPEAMDAVFTFAGGSPRLINLICDLALLSGFTSKSPVISKELVNDCTKKLMLPHNKTSQPRPIAAHKTETIGEQPCSRKRETGWMKPSYGLVILIVLILFGARQFFNKIEVEDGTETTENLPAYNETTATPKAAIPLPAQTLPEVATSLSSEPATEQHLMQQPAAEAPPAAAVIAQESVASQGEAIQIVANEDTPPEIHVQPQKNVEPKAKQAIMPRPAAEAPPAAAVTTQDGVTPQDEATQIVAATVNKGGTENRAVNTSPDTPVLRQEKPLFAKETTPSEIITTSDLHTVSKKVLTVYFGNLRDGPSIKANIIGVGKRGDVVTDLRKKGKWHFVKLDNGRLGWMHRFLFAKPKTATEKDETPEIKAAALKTSSQPVPENSEAAQPPDDNKAEPEKKEISAPSMTETSPGQPAPASEASNNTT
jgi:type II secretory pathway predicted ATPase ExeA